MAFTKEGIALLILTMTQWWTSTTVHVSGDESVKDQMHMLPDGRMECNFADRMILIANHQVNSPLSKKPSWLRLRYIIFLSRRLVSICDA